MAISATIVDIRGKAYEPILEELLFENKTVAENLVSFETDVKAETIFTETTSSVSLQAYSSGAPTSAGSLVIADTAVTPTKIMDYQTFDPESLRTSRFKRDMKAGAWNIASTEFEKVVLGSFAKKVSYTTEQLFWNGITSATQTAIAALTAGTGQTSIGAAEQSWAAAQTAGLLDGVVTKMMYNAAAVGGRVKVAGTTISSSNIATEYAKVYAAIPAVVLSGSLGEAPYIYAPYAHKQLINIFNVTATYRDLFSVDMKADKYFYNGVEIKFVPLSSDNVMIAAIPSNLIWCTDLVADINLMKIDRVAPNQEMMFVKHIFTLAAHVGRQNKNVLYVG